MIKGSSLNQKRGSNWGEGKVQWDEESELENDFQGVAIAKKLVDICSSGSYWLWL